MSTPLTILLLAISILALYFSCTWLVKSVIKIARYFRVSDFVIGFVLVGFATSIPELVVGITSALRGVSELSLGNVIGTNIADITLIFGLVVLLARVIPIHGKIEHKDILLTGFIGLLPILLSLDHNLSRLDGAILVAAFILYLTMLLRQKQYFERSEHKTNSHKSLTTNLIIFAASLTALIFSSQGIVEYGTLLATEIGVPILFIGIVFVAIGTSLPELAFESRAAIKGRPLMAVGDILGSVVVNAALVVGATVLIHPLEFANGFNEYLFPSLAFVFCYILFGVFLFTKKKLTWVEGSILVIVYILFLTASSLLIR